MGDYADLFNAEKEVKQPKPKPVTPPEVPERQPSTDASSPTTRTSERPNERATARSRAAPYARTSVRPIRRRGIKRYSFEFYEDQIERVKRLALEDQLRGGTLNMSEIVREAVDRYLAHLGKANE